MPPYERMKNLSGSATCADKDGRIEFDYAGSKSYLHPKIGFLKPVFEESAT